MRRKKVVLPTVIKLVFPLYSNGKISLPKSKSDKNEHLIISVRNSIKTLRLKNTKAIKVKDGLDVSLCSQSEIEDLIFSISKRAYSSYVKKTKKSNGEYYARKKAEKLEVQYEMEEHIEVADEKNKNLALAILLICVTMVLFAIYYTTK